MAELWLPGRYRETDLAGFDLDGVQRDTGHAAYRTLLKILEAHNKPPIPYRQYLLKQFSHAKYLESLGIEMTVDEINKLYYSLHPPDNEMPPFDDVAPCCDTLLTCGMKLFVVSASRPAWVESWFEDHGIRKHYVEIVHSAHPKAPHLTAMCQRLGVAPAKAFYVGDMGFDMWAAQEAGVVPVGISRYYEGARESLAEAGAEIVVDDLAHLAQLAR